VSEDEWGSKNCVTKKKDILYKTRMRGGESRGRETFLFENGGGDVKKKALGEGKEPHKGRWEKRFFPCRSEKERVDSIPPFEGDVSPDKMGGRVMKRKK